jgi:mediator of RNA polymerase II transcription subunit 18, fungi type
LGSFVNDPSYLSTFLTEGERLTYGNIDIRLFRTFPIPAPASATTSADPKSIVPSAPKDSASLASLDPSGAYLLQVSVRVRDGSKPEMMSRGMAELTALKDLLKGVIDLEPNDRVGLDTRVR